MTDDPKITQRYRKLPREEPPRHLDDAILVAARRAVASNRWRRWYVPLATAAIIVLAVAVTLHVERRRPDDAETVVAMKAEPMAPPREEPARKTTPEQPASKGFVPDPKPQAVPAPTSPPLADSAAQGRDDYERRAAAADLARLQAEAEPPRSERQVQAFAQREGVEESRRKHRNVVVPASPDAVQESASRPAAAASAAGPARYESPEQWLLGIEDLKRQRRHQEAADQLAEFRKRYPNYRIPEAILERFERER